MECAACLLSPATAGAIVLRRLNRKGERGVWMCDDCLKAASPMIESLAATLDRYARAVVEVTNWDEGSGFPYWLTEYADVIADARKRVQCKGESE